MEVGLLETLLGIEVRMGLLLDNGGGEGEGDGDKVPSPQSSKAEAEASCILSHAAEVIRQ